MAHIHFDTESILKDMRENFGKSGCADNDPPEFRAVNRHRDVTISLARMALEEANRGSDPDFIIWMCAQFCAEFLDNMLQLADSTPEQITSVFLQHLLNCNRQLEDGTARAGKSAKLHTIGGGRA